MPGGSIEVSVLFFASAADLAGTERATLVLRAGSNLTDATAAIAAAYPALRDLLARSRVALNMELAGPETRVPDGAELAVLPPVSGG